MSSGLQALPESKHHFVVPVVFLHLCNKTSLNHVVVVYVAGTYLPFKLSFQAL